MRSIFAGLLGLLAVWASSAVANETYDLIFKRGTLAALPEDSTLIYARRLMVADKPETSDTNTGIVELTLERDKTARLKFVRDNRFRPIGVFPAAVGNPIIMYFLETVIRDVAHNTGGSPFYIRNRIKESVVRFAPPRAGTVSFDGRDRAVKQIVLRPFIEDANKHKMRGYHSLALSITVSESVPGWYYALTANVKGTDGKILYSSALTLSENGRVQ